MDSHLRTANVIGEYKNERIIVKDGISKMLVILRYQDVFAFVSYGNYVKVKTEHKVYLSHNSMKRAEAQFCSPNRFIRISRTTIVSKNKITSIEANRVTLSNGKQYAIGRNFRKAFFEVFAKNSF